MRKNWKRLMTSLLIVGVLVSSVPNTVLAEDITNEEDNEVVIDSDEQISVDEEVQNDIEVYDGKKFTTSDVLKLLKKYYPDGYYIIKESINDGQDILSWWNSSEITDGIETAVHEETHGLSFRGVFYGENIFLNKSDIAYVEYGDCFETSKMASHIPKKLRTFRYNTYVAKGAVSSSNLNGAYGLLNEFAAYYQGFNTMYHLKDYFVQNADTFDEWSPYMKMTSTDNAYYEFKYWILRYMLYAKENYPEVYNQILNNKEFCRSYAYIDKNFEERIEEYEASLNQNGLSISNGSVWYGDRGLLLMSEDRDILKTELKKSEYVNMHNLLAGKTTKSKNPITVKARKPSVKYKSLKKKNQAIAKSKAMTVSNAQGKVTFKKVSGNKKISVNKSSGKITVKKGLKKGTYKVKIKVTAAGNSKYKKGSKTVTVSIKVK